MLILDRKAGESINIGGGITITVMEIDKARGRCRLSINAPRDVKILRRELRDRNEPQPDQDARIVGNNTTGQKGN